MKALSLVLIVLASSGIASVAFGQTDSSQAPAETGGENSAKSPALESALSVVADPLMINNFYLSPLVGPNLAPSTGRFETLLGTAAGTFIKHNTTSDTTNVTAETLQAAYGLGSGFYASGLLEYYSISSNSSYGTYANSGLVEPQVALGYTGQLSDTSKIRVQLAYAINSGGQISTGNSTGSSGSTSSNTLRGGSAFIPSVQFETTALLHTTSGIRLSYFVAGDSQRSFQENYNSNGESFSFNETTKETGGNVTVASMFSQQRLTDRVSLGESLSMAWQEGSTDTNGDGVSSTGGGVNVGVVSVNIPIKLGKSIALIPEIDYLRQTANGDAENINAGINGKFAF